MNILKYLLCFFVLNLTYAQNYTSFLIGDSADVTTNPEFGICLMGGATENDNAMQWLLNRADGGDIVVLRTSGSDGYNDYMYNQLGVTVNSVETLRIDQAEGALEPYVLEKVSQAEAIWFAGGDQADYVNFFKNNALGDLLNEHINVKQYPIGGTSAGMAIMGEYYFDALNGTVTSNEALNNPFDSQISLGVSDFLNNSVLDKTITDTHYDNPDRKGRHMVFLARLQAITEERVYGIGLEEYTSACIDENGIARIFGDFPEFEDYAYFIQVNCLDETSPENLTPNQSLDWNLNQEAVKAYKVPGTPNGTNQFNLDTWQTGIGGEWQNWWVDQGNFESQVSVPIDCETFSQTEFDKLIIEAYPNPTKDILKIEALAEFHKIEVFNLVGQKIKSYSIENTKSHISFNAFSKGVYLIKIYFDNEQVQVIKAIKE
jgi:cyanophycinase-like exopeptidase